RRSRTVAARYSRPRENQWHMCRALPKRIFPADSFLPEMPSVIGPEDNDGALRQVAAIQRIEQSANLRIHEADAREISAHQWLPLIVRAQPREPRLGKHPVKIQRERRDIIAIVLLHRGHHERLIRIQIKPFLRCKTRHVRPAKSTTQKKRRAL